MDITKITTQVVQGATLKKLQKTGMSADKFTIEQNNETQPTTASAGIMLTPIDALFLNLDERRKGHKQAIEKSQSILHQLEDLRIGIITGSIGTKTLINIAALLHSHSQSIIDEPLRSILLEVETRARVELAKLEKYS